MRFPVFSSEHFVLPQHQFYGCGPNTGRRGCGSSTMPTRSSLPSWPAGAAAAAGFIPVMMMGPRYRGEPRQRHTAPSMSQGPPRGFCGNRASTSQPDLAEAFNIAQDLLGELFGQPACPSARAEKRGSSTGKKQPASPCSSQGKCHEKTPKAPSSSSRTSDTAQASNPDASDTAPKSSRYEKRTDQSESSPATAQKTEDRRPAEKSEGSRPGETSESQVWRHSLSLFGFAPNKVSVKVIKGAAHVHAVMEKTFGPGTCLHKLETTQVVKLPENIDPKTLTCSMKQNGTLLLQAAVKDNAVDKNKAMEVEMLTNKAEKAETTEDELKTDTIKDKPRTKENVKNGVDNTAVLADQEEKTLSSQSEEERMVDVPEAHASERTADGLNALENKAENKDALEYKPETVCTLQTSAGDLQAPEIMTGPADAEDKAARCTDVELTTAEPDEQDHGYGEEAQETDTERVKNQPAALHVEEDAKNQTTTDTDHDSSFPIIEEPDDDSSGEDLLQYHTITRQSSTEDFVVIADDSINIEAIDAEDGNDDGISKDDTHTDGEATSKDQEQAEDTAEEESDGQTSTSDDTDPTRPIKRTNSQETAQDSITNFGTPGEQSGTVSGNSGTLATDQSHRGAFRASLPLVGFNPEDVHVNLQGHGLRIVAKRQAWLGEASYTESVERELELPGHLDVLTVRCVYQQGDGCLVITAEPHSQERQVPVVLQ